MEHYITTLDELKLEKMIHIEINNQKVLLVYSDEECYAVEDRCPHLNVSLAKSQVNKDQIKCKVHGLAISLKTGEVTSEYQANFLKLNDASRAIKTYPVSINNNKVFITL